MLSPIWVVASVGRASTASTTMAASTAVSSTGFSYRPRLEACLRLIVETSNTGYGCAHLARALVTFEAPPVETFVPGWSDWVVSSSRDGVE